jgi:pilus assembly protein Flp/PilA
MICKNNIRALLFCKKGATAIEYGLIVSLIAIAAVSAMSNFGNRSQGMWNYVQDNIVG